MKLGNIIIEIVPWMYNIFLPKWLKHYKLILSLSSKKCGRACILLPLRFVTWEPPSQCGFILWFLYKLNLPWCFWNLWYAILFPFICHLCSFCLYLPMTFPNYFKSCLFMINSWRIGHLYVSVFASRLFSHKMQLTKCNIEKCTLGFSHS